MKDPRRPVVRRAARALLLDPEGRVLLIEGGDPSAPEAGTWWITPGGGIEAGEDEPTAARREVLEETGFTATALEGPVFRRRSVFLFDGRLIDQREAYFVARTPAFEPTRAGWTDLEHRAMHGHRWWSVAELRTTDETVYPDELADLVEGALGQGESPRRSADGER